MSFEIRLRPGSVGIAVVAYLLVEMFFFKSAAVMPTSVNGRFVAAKNGMTVAQVVKLADYRLTPGDLLDERNRLLLAGGGRQATAKVNGTAIKIASKANSGDAIVFTQGKNVRVRAKKALSVVPAPVKYVGAGHYVTMRAEGSPGKRERIVDSDGEVLSDRVVVQPRPVVLARAQAKPVKVAALTFDDGPNTTYTRQVISILRRYHVTATFFVTGRQAQAHPEMLRSMSRYGFEVENHSFSHSRMDRMPPEAIGAELDSTRDLIAANTGRAPNWFRPPFAAYGGPVYDLLSQRGYGLALWSIDTEDWKAPDERSIVDKVKTGLKPGAVILMHDGGGDRSKTVRALPKIILYLREQGYTLVTLDQIKAP